MISAVVTAPWQRTLKSAASLIEATGATVGACARNAAGEVVRANDPAAVCYCVSGALRVVTGFLDDDQQGPKRAAYFAAAEQFCAHVKSETAARSAWASELPRTSAVLVPVLDLRTRLPHRPWTSVGWARAPARPLGPATAGPARRGFGPRAPRRCRGAAKSILGPLAAQQTALWGSENPMNGMKRAKQEKIAPEIAPAVNQVWEDCDPRASAERGEARHVKITRIDAERAKACCIVQNTSQKGRKTWIGLHRFRPTSTGYRYIRTDHE